MKILIGGDYFPANRISGMLEKDDYSFFDEIKNLTPEYDISILNLEAPIVTGSSKPILKCGPNLKTSAKVIESLKYGGFNAVTLGNNHIMDYGLEGLRETHEILDSSNILRVGTGENENDASMPLFFKKGDKTVAFINCCENEFSIARNDRGGANHLNPIRQLKIIEEAKKKSDYIIYIVHGGHEHWQLPSPRMVETYRFLIDLGADAVINHHQHCFSGFENYKGKPIFFGLGNLCFDNVSGYSTWNEGYLVGLELKDNDIKVDIHPYEQCKDTPRIKMLPQNYFSDRLATLNEIIKDEESLKRETSRYYKGEVNMINSVIQPYTNRILKKLNRIGILPDIIKGEKLKVLENYVMCEAHRDKLDYYFKNN